MFIFSLIVFSKRLLRADLRCNKLTYQSRHNHQLSVLMVRSYAVVKHLSVSLTQCHEKTEFRFHVRLHLNY